MRATCACRTRMGKGDRLQFALAVSCLTCPVTRRATLLAVVVVVNIATLAGASGCATPGQTIGLVVGATLAGGQSPGSEIEQVYYLGVFDPQEQVPPSVYRLTVRGQGSFISQTKFASGWVPANMVDTLNTHIGFEKDGNGIKIEGKGDDPGSGLQTGRRMMMFGPEGFREAPCDHRLVIVMGSNPEKFFNAVGEGLAEVAQVEVAQQGDAARTLMLEELLRLQRENERLKKIKSDAVEATAAATAGEKGELK